MNAKATISSGYRWRLGLLALAGLAFAAWFLYDGLVKYPHMKQMHEQYVRMQKELPASQFNERWVEYAKKHGWPTDQPVGKKDSDILTQYIFAGLTLPLGLLFAFAFIRSGGRWIESDDKGLRTSWRADATWDSITSLDRARWKTKGIAVVHYKDGDIERTITLDDWKYQQEPTTAIVREIASRLGLEDETPTASVEPAESQTGQVEPDGQDAVKADGGSETTMQAPVRDPDVRNV